MTKSDWLERLSFAVIFVPIFLDGRYVVDLYRAKDTLRWAFAQDMDGSVKAKEECRETLADVISNPTFKAKLSKTGTGNVYMFRDDVETYKIFAFKELVDCETALGAVKR